MNQHDNGSFPYKTSYAFWKRKGRQGRELIEEFNAVRTDSYSIKEGNAYDIDDVEDLLNKHGVNKEELRKYLIPMERQIRSLVNELEKVNDKIHSLERDNFDLNNQL